MLPGSAMSGSMPSLEPRPKPCRVSSIWITGPASLCFGRAASSGSDTLAEGLDQPLIQGVNPATTTPSAGNAISSPVDIGAPCIAIVYAHTVRLCQDQLSGSFPGHGGLPRSPR